jgi:CheY-like chemotaxis protein
VQPLITERTLRLIDECPTGAEWQVLADRLRLRQVLVNLLSNAAKYNREHGTITVRCERRADRIRLSVSDTGMGIAPERLAKLFQPFERLGAEFGEVEGTGIGLALSKQLADLMGATLGAETTVGAGSVFWIELPRADSRAAGAPASISAAAPERDMAFDLLYVEDQASNIDVISAFLARHPNVHLQSARTGAAGLDLARARRPDVVLLDIHLPGMDGYQVLQQLRADRQLRDVPVIALSADAMPHDVQRGLAAGFDRYITKPVDLNGLLDALNALLRRGRAPESEP